MPSIKKKSEFESLREKGSFLHVTTWLAICYAQNDLGALRWGWTISRKVGNSVTRNRLKRWGREFVREFNENNLDINFIFKIKNKEFYQTLKRDDFNKAFQKSFKQILSQRR